MSGWAVAGLLCALLVIQTARVALLRGPRAINLIGGISLPLPDDPRWQTSGGPGGLVLSIHPVHCVIRYQGSSIEELDVVVDNLTLPGTMATRRYVRAVRNSYIARRALESA